MSPDKWLLNALPPFGALVGAALKIIRCCEIKT